MDGKNFIYVSGSFHYFRAMPHVWPQRLHTMRLAGLNVVDTYVEWALHNPYPDEYDFDGIADLEQFLTVAQAEGLYVILRPGPYICAERDNVCIVYIISISLLQLYVIVDVGLVWIIGWATLLAVHQLSKYKSTDKRSELFERSSKVVCRAYA